MNGRNFVQSLAANIAEFSLVMNGLRPAMCNGILDQEWCNTRAWSDDTVDTFLVNNKVAH